jgi:hypothetical protein
MEVKKNSFRQVVWLKFRSRMSIILEAAFLEAQIIHCTRTFKIFVFGLSLNEHYLLARVISSYASSLAETFHLSIR